MKTIDKIEVLNRLKQALNLSSDVDLATHLGVNKSTLSNWKARNSIDYDAVFSNCEHINLDWLLTGHGDMLRDEHPKPAQVATIIYKSDPKDIALINLQGKQITLLEEKIAALEQTIVTHSAGLDTARCVDTSSTSGKKRTRD